MVRLADLPENEAARCAGLDCPTVEARPWVEGAALGKRRVAVISAAGLRRRGRSPWAPSMTGSCRRTSRPRTWSCATSRPTTTAADSSRTTTWPSPSTAGRVPLLVHGGDPPRAHGGGAARPGGAAEAGPGRRRPPGPGVTVLQARRRRAGTLPGGGRAGDHPGRPHPRAHRDHAAAARPQGALRAGPPVRRRSGRGYWSRCCASLKPTAGAARGLPGGGAGGVGRGGERGLPGQPGAVARPGPGAARPHHGRQQRPPHRGHRRVAGRLPGR